MTEVPAPPLPSYGLGRVIEPDVRDGDYPFGLVIPQAFPKIKRRQWRRNVWLDQGRTSECVGYGSRLLLCMTPVPVPLDVGPSAQDIYMLATEMDDDPNNTHDPNSGTSVRAGMRALQQFGRVGSYVWASSSDEVANWILRHGPVGLGIQWHAGMDRLDADGYVHPTGPIRGGHFLIAYGTDTVTRTHRLANSWRDWGLGGDCLLTYDDLDWLLEHDGEAVSATERRIRL